jgi:N-methylhydantoinase B
MDAVELSLFACRLRAVCDEMGAVLRRAAFSPNIKDRLDFSCAIFDAGGELCAQAAHIPVHLGSMAYAMKDVVGATEWAQGDMLILNDPFLGGTHLPDVTVVAPVFLDGELCAFVANRAHHADIGGPTPGSMPLSSSLDEEGLVIPPTRIIAGGKPVEEVVAWLRGGLHNPRLAEGDFSAQYSANACGVERCSRLIRQTGAAGFRGALAALNDSGERAAAAGLAELPAGRFEFEDVMDDDGMGHSDIAIHVTLTVASGTVTVDFAGTAAQVAGNINCPLPVTAAAVYYVVFCLIPPETPACAGSFRPIALSAPPGSLVNARRPAAVAAGNVETSMRIVDAVIGALAQAVPERVCAASHGSMNNLAFGAAHWDYYETIGGGTGGHCRGPGLSGVQAHMTNTLNTPIEVLEMSYPLRVRRYALRRGSGGAGRHRGGDGLVREYEFLEPAQVTLLGERRRHPPWGLAGGRPGTPAAAWLNGRPLPGKLSAAVARGDRLLIETGGGGAWGTPLYNERAERDSV